MFVNTSHNRDVPQQHLSKAEATHDTKNQHVLATSDQISTLEICLEASTVRKPQSSETEYPDGGVEAWTVVVGAWCAMIPSMGLLNTLAVLEAWLTEHQLKDVPKTKTAWIFSCYAFFLYFCGAQVGPVFDARDVRWLIVPGSVGIVVSLLLLSFSQGRSTPHTRKSHK